ncbi:hypothetical protein [Streptomyces kronopolitis]
MAVDEMGTIGGIDTDTDLHQATVIDGIGWHLATDSGPIQSLRRRQAVTPLHATSSAGTSRQFTLVRSTQTMPHTAAPSTAGSRPVHRWRRRDGPAAASYAFPQAIRHKTSSHTKDPAVAAPNRKPTKANSSENDQFEATGSPRHARYRPLHNLVLAG